MKAKEVTLHICETCNKEFASPYNLRRHQLTHTDEKPYQCEVCNRQFKEKSSLTKHIKRKHTGVDQGSQTDETGEQEDGYVNVDVIAESAAVSGVTMETEETVEAGIAAETVEGASTVDASSLIPGEEEEEEEAQGGAQQVTEVVQASGEVEMATVELQLANAAAAQMSSVHMLMQHAVQNKMITHQMDVKTAYLNEPIDCDICMEQPKGFKEIGKDSEKLVCKLKKSLYSLKQSRKNWNNMLLSFLCNENFFSVTC